MQACARCSAPGSIKRAAASTCSRATSMPSLRIKLTDARRLALCRREETSELPSALWLTHSGRRDTQWERRPRTSSFQLAEIVTFPGKPLSRSDFLGTTYGQKSEPCCWRTASAYSFRPPTLFEHLSWGPSSSVATAGPAGSAPMTATVSATMRIRKPDPPCSPWMTWWVIIWNLGAARPPVSLRPGRLRPSHGTVSHRVLPRFGPAAERAGYFAAIEALTNVAKHSGTSRADVVFWRDTTRLFVEVWDNGHSGAVSREGGQLAGLRDRVATVDGTIDVVSPPGGPTMIRVALPITATSATHR